jgi:hypothetical protein
VTRIRHAAVLDDFSKSSFACITLRDCAAPRRDHRCANRGHRGRNAAGRGLSVEASFQLARLGQLENLSPHCVNPLGIGNMSIRLRRSLSFGDASIIPNKSLSGGQVQHEPIAPGALSRGLPAARPAADACQVPTGRASSPRSRFAPASPNLHRNGRFSAKTAEQAYVHDLLTSIVAPAFWPARRL